MKIRKVSKHLKFLMKFGFTLGKSEYELKGIVFTLLKNGKGLFFRFKVLFSFCLKNKVMRKSKVDLFVSEDSKRVCGFFVGGNKTVVFGSINIEREGGGSSED